MGFRADELTTFTYLDHTISFIRTNFGEYFPSEGYYLLLCFILITFPLCGLVVLATSCRRVRLQRSFKILFFFGVGTLQFFAMISTSWIEADGTCLIREGPHSVQRMTKIGLRTGIWDIITYCEIRNSFGLEFVFHQVEIANVGVLHQRHLEAMRSGSSWPIAVVTSQLGGESKAWDGGLGRCFNKASSVILSFLVLVFYLWFLWGSIYKFAPSLSPPLMTFLGFIQFLSALSYYYVLWTCPPVMLPTGGNKLTLNFGWPGLLTGGCGIMLSSMGLLLQLTTRMQTKPVKRHQMRVRDSRMSITEIEDLEEQPSSPRIYIFGSNDEQNPNLIKFQQNIKLIEGDYINMKPTELSDENNINCINDLKTGEVGPITSQMFTY